MKVSSIFSESLASAKAIDHVTDKDSMQYDLCVALWCSLVEDCTNRNLALDLASAIRRCGLIRCIESADKYAKSLLSEDCSTEASILFRVDGLATLWQQIACNCKNCAGFDAELSDEAEADFQVLVNRQLSPDDWVVAFACEVVLRFPKRYTVCDPPVESAVKKFLQVHHDDVVFTNTFSRWPGNYILSLLRECMREILIPKNKKIIAKIIKECTNTTGSFSNGAAYYPGIGTSRVPAAKYGFLSKLGYYVDNHSLYDGYIIPGRPDYRRHLLYDVKVMAVPKDYETSRMIAPETPYLNIRASRVRKLIIALTEATGYIREMPPEDQSLNRLRAKEGSLAWVLGATPDLTYCTADLSHASDSIVRSLFFAILPQELHKVVRQALSDAMIVDHKRYHMAMLATSGSVLTPILESTFFLAILHAACYLCGLPRDKHKVSAYNDDLICTADVFPTLCELLELLGLTVNLKKTYSSGAFRESCGGEYVCGIDVTGVYWPRKALKLYKCTRTPDPETLQQLIAMQHKLYRYPTVRRVLDDLVISIYPKMSYSCVGSTNSDLWAPWMSELQTLEERHVAFRSRFTHQYLRGQEAIHGLTSEGMRVLEHIRYYDFLRNGPVYDDPLCELLGVTSDQTSWRHAECLPTTEIYLSDSYIR